jgi:hypothetical protein
VSFLPIRSGLETSRFERSLHRTDSHLSYLLYCLSEPFQLDFASIPSIELEDYTFTPSFDVDVESVLASMHAEAEATKIQAIQAEAAAMAVVPVENKVATIPVEKKVTKATSTVTPTVEAKRRQTLGSSASSSSSSSSASTVSSASSANNKNKRASVVPTAAAAIIGRSTARVSLAPRPRTTPVVNVKVIASSRQPLAPVRNGHKLIKSTNTSRPTSACSTSSTSTDASKPKVNLKTRVSLAPMSKKERFADLGKGKGYVTIGGDRWD